MQGGVSTRKDKKMYGFMKQTSNHPHSSKKCFGTHK